MGIATISEARKKELSSHGFAIETSHKKVENIINGYIAEHADASFSITTKEIPYYGRKIIAYIVPFQVALYLATNRASEQLSFIAYHDVKNDNFWIRWDEEKGKTKRAQKVVKRGATSFHQRGSK